MTETIKELFERKSLRVFSDKDISENDKKLILESAFFAPTAGNQQLYTIIDVTDQNLKDSLSITCDNQPFISKAKMVLIFCADAKKWFEGFQISGCNPRNPGVGDLLLAVSDANIAAQNAVTAAWSLGIGSCYIGDIMENYEKQKELLNIPKYVFPAAMVVFGYPTDEFIYQRKPKRAPYETIVSENTYPKMDSEYYQKMFSQNIGSEEYEDWIKKFCNRKYNSDFSVEMTRSVSQYLNEYGNIL